MGRSWKSWPNDDRRSQDILRAFCGAKRWSQHSSQWLPSERRPLRQSTFVLTPPLFWSLNGNCHAQTTTAEPNGDLYGDRRSPSLLAIRQLKELCFKTTRTVTSLDKRWFLFALRDRHLSPNTLKNKFSPSFSHSNNSLLSSNRFLPHPFTKSHPPLTSTLNCAHKFEITRARARWNSRIHPKP